MKTIKIKVEYIDNRWTIANKINEKISAFGVQIQLIEYDDNRVYRTGERQLATRMDCMAMMG